MIFFIQRMRTDRFSSFSNIRLVPFSARAFGILTIFLSFTGILKGDESTDGRAIVPDPVRITVDGPRSMIESAAFVHSELRDSSSDFIGPFLALLDTLNLTEKDVFVLLEDHQPVFSEETREEAREIKKMITKNFDEDQQNKHGLIAFTWFLDLMEATTSERIGELLKIEQAKEYAEFFFHENGKKLRDFLKFRYFSDEESKEYDHETLEAKEKEFNMVNGLFVDASPYRSRWDFNEQIMKWVNLQDGEVMLDANASFGYYPIRFAKACPGAKIHALNFYAGSSEFIQFYCQEHGVKNITTGVADVEGFHLPPQSADVVFIHMFYHMIYIDMKKNVRQTYLSDLARVIKKDGRLVIIDTAPGKSILGYSLDPRFVEGQLQFYGFRLTKRESLSETVYYLEFVKE